VNEEPTDRGWPKDGLGYMNHILVPGVPGSSRKRHGFPSKLRDRLRDVEVRKVDKIHPAYSAEILARFGVFARKALNAVILSVHMVAR
jgi:hypothetical protein